MVKKAMPPELQENLDAVVGLMRMHWKMFEEHSALHGAAQDGKKTNRRTKKNTSVKLAQLQLGELAEKKKNKGKNQTIDIQAPLVTAAVPPQVQEVVPSPTEVLLVPKVPTNQMTLFAPFQVVVDARPQGP